MADVGVVRYEVQLDDPSTDQNIDKTEKKLSSKLGGIGKKVGGVAMKGIVVGSAALATGTVAAGKAMLDMAGDVSKTGDEIDKMSQKIGISAEAYQEWAYVFERSGADISGMQVGMKTLAGVITDAGKGSEGAQEKLAALGLTFEDLSDMSQEDQFATIVTRLQDMESGAERTAVASDLLGRSATDMAAIFNMTAEDTQALIDETHEYGMIMSDDAVAASAAYQDSLTKVQHTMDGLKNKAAAAILPALTDVVNGIADIATGSKDADTVISDGINGIADTISENLPGLIKRGTEIITSIIKGIANNLPALVNCAVVMIGALADGLVQNLPTILDAAIKLVAALVKGLIDLAPELLKAAVKLVVELGKYLVEQHETLKTKARELMDKMIEAIKNIDWLAVGKAIVDGIAEGIAKFGSSVLDGIKNLGSNALGAAKETFKINSPSKLFRDEVGAAIPEGIAVGIEENEDMVFDSLATLTADVNYNLPDMSAAAENLGAAITASSSASITVPLIVDGREMARATAWYTNEQLAWEARG